ncbi:MAG: hypothetical protein JJ992_23880, partial [Planctomycetes bacterium]|nr:hypothetical protein [Planctomycetota bacterium]
MSTADVHDSAIDHQKDPTPEEAKDQSSEASRQRSRKAFLNQKSPYPSTKDYANENGDRLKNVVLYTQVRPSNRITHDVVSLTMGDLRLPWLFHNFSVDYFVRCQRPVGVLAVAHTGSPLTCL